MERTFRRKKREEWKVEGEWKENMKVKEGGGSLQEKKTGGWRGSGD